MRRESELERIPTRRTGGDPAARPGERTPMLTLLQNFYLGGTEGQVVELLRRLPSRWDMHLACIIKNGPHLASVRALGLEPLELPLKGKVAQLNTGLQILRLAQEL